MKDIVETAQAVESLGVTGILAGVVIILLFVVKKQFEMREDCQKKLLKLAQGKEISE